MATTPSARTSLAATRTESLLCTPGWCPGASSRWMESPSIVTSFRLVTGPLLVGPRTAITVIALRHHWSGQGPAAGRFALAAAERPERRSQVRCYSAMRSMMSGSRSDGCPPGRWCTRVQRLQRPAEAFGSVGVEGEQLLPGPDARTGAGASRPRRRPGRRPPCEPDRHRVARRRRRPGRHRGFVSTPSAGASTSWVSLAVGSGAVRSPP